MNSVVFGANGFIGSHVCAALLGAGHRVRAFDISRDFRSLEHLDSPLLETCTGDFLDRMAVKQALEGVDWVFHLVSTTIPSSSNNNMVFDVQSNVVASIELLEECVAGGVSRLIFASSGGTVYGCPATDPVSEDAPKQPIVSYGCTKLAIENYCQLFQHQTGLRTISLRLANPYGPGHHGMSQGAIPVFLKRIRSGKPVSVWGDGCVTRDYVYVDDLADAFLKAAVYEGKESVFNIGSGQGVSLLELIALLKTETGREVEVLHEAGRNYDVPRIVLDVSRARHELGWAATTPLQGGIRRTWQHLLAQEPHHHE